MNKETIMADHSQAYMFDIDVDNQTTLNSVGIYEVAALLNMCDKNLIVIDVFGKQEGISLPRYKTKCKRIKLKGEWELIKKRLEIEGWIEEAKMFLKDVTKSMDESSAATLIFETESAAFNVKFAKSASGFSSLCQMICSCSPTKLISGQNALPLLLGKEPKEKARDLMRLYTLPVYIIHSLIFKEIENYSKSSLAKCLKNRDIKFTWLQITAYSEPFDTRTDMLRAISVIDNIYGASFSNPGINKRVQVAKSVNSVRKTKEEWLTMEDGKITTSKGFSILKRYGNYSLCGLTGYAKGSETDDDIFEGMGEENQDLIERSLRLDLNLYKTGFENLNKKLNIDIPKMDMSANKIEQFFCALFKKDITGGLLFSLVLKDYLHLGAFLLVQRKHWFAAFEFLKSKNMYSLVEHMKEGYTFAEALKKENVSENPVRFAEKINNEVKKLNDVGSTYFDIRDISYGAWVSANYQIRSMYVDIDEVLKWYDGEKTNYDPTEDSRRARKDTRKIARHLCEGKLQYMLPVGNLYQTKT